MAKKYVAKGNFKANGEHYACGDEYEGKKGKDLLEKGLICEASSEEGEAAQESKRALDTAALDSKRAEIRASGDKQPSKKHVEDENKKNKEAAPKAKNKKK